MDKPLPELPHKTHRSHKHPQPNTNWATLSVDAQEHLHKFILHALEESDDAVPQDEWEEWATGVEHALRDLGERISLGGWLVGIRRAKMLRIREKAERLMAKKVQGSDTVISRKDDGPSSVRGKGSQPNGNEPGYFTLGRYNGKSAGQASQTSEAEPSFKETLQSLRTQATTLRASPGPKPTAKHLLLTVAPPGRMPVTDQSDAEEYEFPRSQFTCSFFPGVFAMPQAGDSEEDEHGVILYGLDTWDGE